MTEPLYTTRKLQRHFFGFKVERPQAAPGKVLVLTGGGAPIVLWSNQKPTAGEAAWNHYDTVIEIDTARRDFTFTTPVAALGGGFAFQMTFAASYCVSDPLRVLNEGLINPEPALRRVITESASRVTEKYDIENAPEALAAVRAMLEKGQLTEKLPFALSAVNVKLDLDSKASEHLARLRQQRRDAELAKNAHKEAAAQVELDKQRKSHEHDLAHMQAKHDLDLERQRTEHQLELEKVKAQTALDIQMMRMEVYRPLVQGGIWDMLALQLSQNPGDVTQVSDMIMQMQSEQRRAGVAVLETMVRGDIVQDHHLKEVIADLVRQLRASTLSLGTAPEARQLSTNAEEADRDQRQPSQISEMTRPVNENDQARDRTIVRFTDVTCPRSVWVGEGRVPVLVNLTLIPSPYSTVLPKAIQPILDCPVDVHITAPNFEVLEHRAKVLSVFSDRDSEPVVFYLQPQAAGPARLSLDFTQAGQPVGTLAWTVEITRQQVPYTSVRLGQLLELAPDALRPDLLLYVAEDLIEGRPHLRLTLYTAGAEQGESFTPLPVQGHLGDYAAGLYKLINGWVDAAAPGAAGFGGSQGIASLPDALRQVGEKLWLELFPADFKRAYAARRAGWAGKTLLVMSDEPYIPWELVCPYSADPAADWADDPWCLSLNLMRWLRRGEQVTAPQPPKQHFALGALACVAPGDSGLHFAQEERQFLGRWAQTHGVRDAGPAACTLSAVRGLAEAGGYDWLHVAAHGVAADPASVQPGAVYLEGSDEMTADCFVGRRPHQHIAGARPGFFLNACHGGRQGWGLTYLSGWAPRLLELGAGAIVAPLWIVDDQQALAFARTFYEGLPDETIGEALRRARREVAAAGNAAALAYSVFAHPQARVQVGAAV